MKTGTVEFLPLTFLTDAELSRALASSPDELARETAHRLAESAEALDQIGTAYADALIDIGGSLVDAIGALVDVMGEIECDDQDLFIQLDRIRSDLETLSASVSAKEATL